MQEQLTPDFGDYELLDTGDFEKLERFGRYVTRRPEPQAPGQKAQFYGQRAGAFPGVGRKAGAGLGPAQVPLPRCVPEIFWRTEPPLRHPARPLRGRV